MKNVIKYVADRYTIGALIIMIIVVIVSITVFKITDTTTVIEEDVPTVVDDPKCWYAGTVYGNNWENGKYEIVLCKKTREEILSEYI